MISDCKKLVAGAVFGASLFGMSASANAGLLNISKLLDASHLIATFEFVGNFQMIAPDGNVIENPDSSIRGVIALDFFTFGGTASMMGSFLNAPFTANGGLSAYVDPLGFGNCAGNFLCADSLIDFKYLGFNIPVEASFALDPFNPFIRSLSQLKIGLSFDVSSIDRDGDGIPGTALTFPLFAGITPSFTGVATLSKLSLGKGLPNPGLDYSSGSNVAAVPEPGEWALMLAGLGLIGWRVGRRNRA